MTLLALGMVAAITAAPMAAQPLVINTAFDDNDSSLIVGRLTEAVNNVAMIFPEVRGVTITSNVLPLEYYAVTDGEIIQFNDLYMSNPEIVEAMVLGDVSQGFHPPLGECTPEEFLAYHEAAHVIDRGKDMSPRERVAIEYGSATHLPLSGYSFVSGTLNPGEALAEAFAATLCGSANAIEQDLYTILTD